MSTETSSAATRIDCAFSPEPGAVPGKWDGVRPYRLLALNRQTSTGLVECCFCPRKMRRGDAAYNVRWGDDAGSYGRCCPGHALQLPFALPVKADRWEIQRVEWFGDQVITTVLASSPDGRGVQPELFDGEA